MSRKIKVPTTYLRSHKPFWFLELTVATRHRFPRALLAEASWVERGSGGNNLLSVLMAQSWERTYADRKIVAKFINSSSRASQESIYLHLHLCNMLMVILHTVFYYGKKQAGEEEKRDESWRLDSAVSKHPKIHQFNFFSRLLYSRIKSPQLTQFNANAVIKKEDTHQLWLRNAATRAAASDENNSC